MYAFQRSFLYLPHINNHLRVIELNAPAEQVAIPSESGITLKSWFYNNPANRYTVLFFHGNAGELDNRIYKLNEFKNLHLNYLIISWRGFSGNPGKPTEMGLYEDAKSAIQWLEKNNISKDKIILYGESLGTGIAVEVAQQQNFAGVILESPYTSMADSSDRKSYTSTTDTDRTEDTPHLRRHRPSERVIVHAPAHGAGGTY